MRTQPGYSYIVPVAFMAWIDKVSVDCPYDFVFEGNIAYSIYSPSYVEIEQWCLENFENDFCLYLNAVDCASMIDLMAFKLAWV